MRYRHESRSLPEPDDYTWIRGLAWGNIASCSIAGLFIFPGHNSLFTFLIWGPFLLLGIVLLCTAMGAMVARMRRIDPLPLPPGTVILVSMGVVVVTILILRILNDSGQGGF